MHLMEQKYRIIIPVEYTCAMQLIILLCKLNLKCKRTHKNTVFK